MTITIGSIIKAFEDVEYPPAESGVFDGYTVLLTYKLRHQMPTGNGRGMICSYGVTGKAVQYYPAGIWGGSWAEWEECK